MLRKSWDIIFILVYDYSTVLYDCLYQRIIIAENATVVLAVVNYRDRSLRLAVRQGNSRRQRQKDILPNEVFFRGLRLLSSSQN